jgi:hypothetical protein
MPYYHDKCEGQIKWYPPLPIPPKCSKCGKTWNPIAVYGLKPVDMYFVPGEYKGPKLAVKKGNTSYAKWGDNVPGISTIASNLPSWPRWLRITAFLGIIALLSGGFYGLAQIGVWAIVLGVLILLVVPLLLVLRKKKID